MEDVAGSTWKKAWERLSTLGDASHFKSWLATIARNEALDHLRRKSRREEGRNGEGEELVSLENIEDQVITKIALGEAQRAAFKRMRPKQRKCFIYHIRGSTIENIAKRLSLTEDTVKTYIRSAYRILHEEFRKRLDGDQKDE
jgi:RNA polymerase sigma-70 factor (ECF subfamily)